MLLFISLFYALNGIAINKGTERMKYVFSTIAVLVLLSPCVRGEDIPEKYQKVIDKGLDWLAKQQARDGHWEANGGQYPTTMTALAGMALLMEGSTMREGKYSERIRRAVDWLVDRSQRNGLIGNP